MNANNERRKEVWEPSPFRPDMVNDYYVFVKMAEVGARLLTLRLGWHTETMFCEVVGNGTKAINDYIADKRFTEGGGFAYVTANEATRVKEFMGNCTSTGFKGLGPTWQQFDDGEEKFYDGPHAAQELIYVGRATVDIEVLLENMKICGNWENPYYDILDYNCNYYTRALMASMDLPSPTVQGEKIFFPPWIPDPGYFHVATFTCRGTKCTGIGGEMKKGEEDSLFATSARKGKCSEGVCHGGGKFISESRSCK